jgi:hypothetical protein
MQPLRIRIDRVVDFGTVVSLVGVDAETAEPVAIHIDYRAFAAFWATWREMGSLPPVEYTAERLILQLDMQPVEGADSARLIEADVSSMTPTTDQPLPVQEVEQ